MNRVVLITGASSGIGEATALALAEHFRLVLVARRRDRLLDLVDRIHRQGGQAWAIAADLTGNGVPERVAEEAAQRGGGELDALINNAGSFQTAAIGALDSDHAESLWRLNVHAPMMLTRAALPYLRGKRGGMIINVSSVVTEQTFTGCGVYTATKCAIEGWSRVLREELRGTNVRVGVIAPGATDTEIWPASTNDAQRQRMARAADVAAAIRLMLECPATANIDRLTITPPGGAL
jgi:NADP-dependent 3-hydroxy acid dehydrogenase YdfG